MKTMRSKQQGFTTLEIIVGAALSVLVLGGLYRLWGTNQAEGDKLQRKIDMRNQIALSHKKLNESITLAGYGMQRAVGIAKEDAVNSDTLFIYTNENQQETTLSWAVHGNQRHITVTNGNLFANASHIAVSNGVDGEVRKISYREGSTLIIARSFDHSWAIAGTKVIPAIQEKFYTDLETKTLIRKVGNTPTVIGRNLSNFQVSFRNKNGLSTENYEEIRFIHYAITGHYPAREGALSTMVIANTTIPRNIL